MNISDKMKALTEIIRDANLMIDDLRKECTHNDYSVSYHSNIGYVRDDDDFWCRLHCNTCGFTDGYSSEGSEEEKKFYYGTHPKHID